MTPAEHRTKLTLTIDPGVIKEAHKVATEKGMSLSRLVENFLVFVSSRKVYCFSCGKAFSSKDSDICPKCGWMRCTGCKACRCSLGEEAGQVAFYMRKVYEDLLGGRVR